MYTCTLYSKRSKPPFPPQICDRPKDSIDMEHIGSRSYVQPQWIFDSINQRKLLPTHKYFVGETLPPHLSPFAEQGRRVGDYIPPEEKKIGGEGQEDSEREEEDSDVGRDSEGEDEDGSHDEEAQGSEDSEEESDSEQTKDSTSMSVEVGRNEIVDSRAAAKAMEDEEFKLREKMVPNKNRNLYKSMMKSRKKRIHESKQLEWKRKQYEESKAKESGNKKNKGKK